MIIREPDDPGQPKNDQQNVRKRISIPKLQGFQKTAVVVRYVRKAVIDFEASIGGGLVDSLRCGDSRAPDFGLDADTVEAK